MAWMNEWVDVRKCTSSIVIGAEKVGKISEDCGKPVSLEPCSLACFPFAYTFCSAVSTLLCIPKNSVVVGPCIHSGSSTQSRCFFPGLPVGPVGLHCSCSISQTTVEHVKNALQNITTEWTPHSSHTFPLVWNVWHFLLALVAPVQRKPSARFYLFPSSCGSFS